MLAWITLPLFLLAIFLIIIAIICQLLELRASNRTIYLETEDIREVRPERAPTGLSDRNRTEAEQVRISGKHEV
jgi:hypothetical protein